MSLEVLHLQLISAVLTKLLTWDFGYKTPRHIQILNDYCGPFAYLLYFHAKFSSYFPHTKENCFPFSFSRKFSLYYFFWNVCLRLKCGWHRKGVLSSFFTVEKFVNLIAFSYENKNFLARLKGTK